MPPRLPHLPRPPSPLFATCLLLCCLASRGPAGAANLGIVHGSAVDAAGHPVEQTRVTLLRQGQRVDEHACDAAGHFDFDQVPFGTWQLLAHAPGGLAGSAELHVSSGEVVRVELVLAKASAEEELTVVAEGPRAPAPARRSSSVSTLEHHDIQALPRGDSQGVNELLATQPGFVYDSSGNLFVRGNHANLQYQLDGVPLPDSVSGLFGSLVSPKLVDDIEVTSGGLPAEYGERLAAVVNLNSRRPSAVGEGELELLGGSFQTAQLSASYGQRFGAAALFAGVSLRRTDRALDPQVFEDLSHDSGDEERLFLRADDDLDEHTHVSLVTSYARNFYRLPTDSSVPAWNPALPDGGRQSDAYGNAPAPYFPPGTDQTEEEHDAFALLALRREQAGGGALRASLSVRHSIGLLNGDAAHALGHGADPCTTDDSGARTCQSQSDVNRRADHLGASVEQQLRLGDDHVLKAGAQLDQLFGSTDFTSYTRSDALDGPDPSLTVRGTDRSRGTTFGLYLQDRATMGPLVLDAGLRLDGQRVAFVGSPESSIDLGLSPRLGAALSLGPDTVVHAFAGLLWQPPPVLDTPAAARILGVVPPGQPVTYDLKPEQGRSAELGIESRVLPALSLKLTAWGRLSSDQLDDVAVGSTNLISPYNFRDGRAAGLEAGAVLVLGRWLRAFANGSLEKAQGRGIETARYLFAPADLASDQWQILDHVQTLTANAGATVRDGHTRLSALVEYGSGLRTGANNDQTVPGHVRVDLTLAHEFAAAPAKPTVALDVVNAFDAHYAYRIGNGFNGSHQAPGRQVALRLSTPL